MPADRTKGRILIACNRDFEISADQLAVGNFSITGIVRDRSNNDEWAITGVYGPQEDGDKIQFLQEMRQTHTMAQQKWMLIGDFNLIRRANEKRSSNLNLRMMGCFRNTIDDLELLEIPLHGTLHGPAKSRTLTTFLLIEFWCLKNGNCRILNISCGRHQRQSRTIAQ